MARQQKRAAQRADAKAKKAPVNVPAPVAAPAITLVAPKRFKAEDLDDIQVRGVGLAKSVEAGEDRRFVIDGAEDDAETVVFSYLWRKHRANHDVKRTISNKTGKLEVDYACDCGDYSKMGRGGCFHVIAEQILRKEVIIVGDVSTKRMQSAKAQRRPKRKRFAADGRPIEAAQTDARIRFPKRLPMLLNSLRRAYEREHPTVEDRKRGGQPTPYIERALVLIYKISYGKSAEAMQSIYEDLIAKGHLRIARPPHPNTISDWMNDPMLTPILNAFIAMTAYPFRRREIGGIIDSSKISQMRTAHSFGVTYRGDERHGVHWMRCHALVGVETLICMAVAFSGVRGEGVADKHFVKPLVTQALKQFALQYLLADKAYFEKSLYKWLWDLGILCTVPIKKNVIRPERKVEYDVYTEAVIWFDDFRREFQEIYRLRPKIEAFFSALKRAAQDFCWSRGRLPEGADPNKPSDAWVNEALCKFIFMNTMTTNSIEVQTGVEIDYCVPERCFPEPLEPLLLNRAAA